LHDPAAFAKVDGMRRFLLVTGLCALAALAGGVLAWRLSQRPEPKGPDTPAVIARVREAARLETLDVTLYKKIDFSPDPAPADSVWGAVGSFARYAVRPPRGKAIVFAEAHLSIDLRRLDDRGLRVEGKKVQVVLPRLETKVELRPAETEIIGSNLDSAETAQLFALAKEAFAREVGADAALREKAQESARRSLRALLGTLGFWQIEFVESLPAAPALQ
jgi:hypothetical protein